MVRAEQNQRTLAQ